LTDAATQDWADARWRFIEAGGRTTQSFGLGRMIGQIYAILYLNDQAMCLDEIAEGLAVSKASVSIGVRQLEDWRAVRKVWIKGDRKDFYAAETDFGTILRSGILESIGKKVATAGEQLALVEASVKQATGEQEGDGRKHMENIAKRLKSAKKFHSKINGLLNNPIVKKLL
jgi:DNA-binding transcriptional regulator GbsR (MarR family)